MSKSDIEIAQEATLKPIIELAKERLGIEARWLEPYGHYKAKLSLDFIEQLKDRPDGKLVLVTAISPTPAGEGKTTTTVGLGDALNRIGKKTIMCLREPSLGPVFGVKGGAAGGGYSQVVPMADINLHFTGDFHAITSAHALLAAMIDNHLYRPNTLRIDPRRIVWRRAVDMNDRALRKIVVGLGGIDGGIPREDGFMITTASEIMAILALASDLQDLKRRFGDIIVAYTYDRQPVRARDLGAEGAMTLLMKDAIMPNLVQTLGGTPAFVHAGPFGNIAHGCNSLIATRSGLTLGDIVVTEAGFGADLGAEKFFNIKCRTGGLRPDAAVVVGTIRALKMHGGVPKTELDKENVAALERGMENIIAHVENVKKFGVPPVVALNRFVSDTDAEIETFVRTIESIGVPVAVADPWGKGGEGVLDLADAVLDTIAKGEADFRPLYELDQPLTAKIETIAREIYGADGVDYLPAAKRELERLEQLGLGNLPVCMAKTQYSFSDNPALLGRPRGFRITVREVRPSAGAGFVVVQTGDIMTMPGLPESPAAERMSIEPDGTIVGLA